LQTCCGTSFEEFHHFKDINHHPSFRSVFSIKVFVPRTPASEPFPPSNSIPMYPLIPTVLHDLEHAMKISPLGCPVFLDLVILGL
jgi:hypothetical protein